MGRGWGFPVPWVNHRTIRVGKDLKDHQVPRLDLLICPFFTVLKEMPSSSKKMRKGVKELILLALFDRYLNKKEL